MRVYLESLGCKLNQSEIEALAYQFANAGHQVVVRAEEADLCVINTCTVTHIAARKSRKLIRSLHRINPKARLVVTGCYAEMSPQEIECLEGVDLVVGNKDKEHIVELIGSGGRQPATSFQLPVFRTRAFVKIQDGCNNHCAYCIVRLARGRERSRPVEEILAEIKARVATGYKEIVLTGVNIGAYGKDFGSSLGQLIEEILARTEVPRLRLSSIEPWDLTPDLLPLWEDSRLCRHLHLPLQSGCSATLLRMGRRYTAVQYADTVRMAREAIPDLAVTTDIIVGFPGESEAEFEESYRFVKEMGFARIHVFKFSPRPGTPAAEMDHQVPYAVKRRRSEAMRELAQRSGERFRRRFLGRTMEVLWESAGKDGLWSGLTDNYIRVTAESKADLSNTISSARLVGLTKDGMKGLLLKGPPDREERDVRRNN